MPTIDTHDFTNPHAFNIDSTLNIDLMYPRVDGNISEVVITLYDVRAANNITIRYDYERNGWIVLSDCVQPEDDDVDDPQLHEVAFIPAWPRLNGEN